MNVFLLCYHIPMNFYMPEKQIFTQRLDHLNVSDQTTFSQYYYLNDTFYDKSNPDSPIIIYLGGGDVLSYRYFDNPAFEIANKTSGLFLHLELRYFGDSQPFTNTTITNLQYLTVEQILADIENFASSFRSKSEYKNASVILIGGGVAGTFATWCKLRYPDTINFTWASSSPLKISNSFFEYDLIASQIILNISSKCFAHAASAYSELIQKIIDNGGTISQDLKEGYDFSYIPNNISFLEVVSDIFNQLIYNQATVRTFCSEIVGSFDNETIFRKYYHSFITKKKIDPSFYDIYSFKSQNSTSPYASHRAWTYLACNQLGWFPISSGFSPPQIDQTYFQNACFDLFQLNTSSTTRRQMNLRYGEEHPSVTYTIFTTSLIDPYSYIGSDYFRENKDFNDENLSVVTQEVLPIRMDNSNHCFDLNPETPLMDNDNVAVNKSIDTIIRWVKNTCNRTCNHGTCVLEQCICEGEFSGENCDVEVIESENFWIAGISAVITPLLILTIVGGSAWWLFRRIQEEKFLQTLQY